MQKSLPLLDVHWLLWLTSAWDDLTVRKRHFSSFLHKCFKWLLISHKVQVGLCRTFLNIQQPKKEWLTGQFHIKSNHTEMLQGKLAWLDFSPSTDELGNTCHYCWYTEKKRQIFFLLWANSFHLCYIDYANICHIKYLIEFKLWGNLK